jgi:ComF family protein
MNIFSFLLSTLFPESCVFCKQEGEVFCESCFLLKKNTFQVCPLCLKPSLFGKVCCKKRTALSGLFVFSSYDHTPELVTLIHRMKYTSARFIAKRMGKILFSSLFQENPEFLEYEVCAVPLHWKKLLERGYNQSKILASGAFKKPLSLLKRNIHTESQTHLSKKERLLNVKDAFSCPQKISGVSRVLLVDDVASSLATLEECAKVLKKNGVKEVFGVVLARNR